jgi:hypothetical protein
MGRRRAVLTYRNYAALPQGGRRYEIHDGARSVTPAATPVDLRHSQARARSHVPLAVAAIHSAPSLPSPPRVSVNAEPRRGLIV